MFENRIFNKSISISAMVLLLAGIGTAGQISIQDTAMAATGTQQLIFSGDDDIDTTTLEIAKKYLEPDTLRFSGQSYWQTVSRDFDNRVFDSAPDNRRIMFTASLDTMKLAIPEARQQGIDVLAYDAEIWEFTPSYEQTHPVESFNQAASIAHNNGFKFAYHPTMKIFRGPDLNYLKQDWTKADVLVIPYGGLVKDPSNFALQVQKVVNHVKSKNPNIEIYIFISLRYATPTQIVTAMDRVKTLVNGAAVSYHPESGCTYCTEANLDKLLAGLTD